ncbi:glycogen debranching protein GlgX [Marinomonas algicola]|uniref:glycogen debranching protein GlgX n=1 Tax=Marinomonas algicola TaxID=2773454 RepID=UPI00174CB074|nr:glycogen debranching protein GlgX [Marinomonas algicola]
MNDFTLEPGSPITLGASLTQDGVNFAVFSKHATQIYLCIFDGNEEVARLPFKHKTQSIWHSEVIGLTKKHTYGYRAVGPFKPDQQHLFNVNKLLMDPYAKSFTEGLYWHPDQSAVDLDGNINNADSAHCVPKSVIFTSPYTSQEHRPPRAKIAPQERSLYELHVKGFSQQLDIKDDLKGTYLGVISEKGLQHLKRLGVTTIQLMPCFSFATESRLTELNLTNYWGYNPISFFAAEKSYALDNELLEFKQMIDGLRSAGFEVILDVVYNHTVESELHQSSVCFKGLDNATYYRHDHGHYLNYTGCGNCIDTFQDNSLRLIMDSMRYWVEEMGVDGFRFDLGVDLGRTQHEFSAKAPLLQAILQDPVLRQTCLVAEPWDIGPNGYQVGQFPNGFLECNDQYRDTLRRFWRGDEGQTQALATRLMGSRDFFHKGSKSALTSVNYVTYHDGYTLRDLVSYHRRHNLANMENNRDGHGDNISQNFGVEGTTTDDKVNKQRLNQQLCMLATLLLSQGTPHILGGDELSHSQNGNNNAYCQDNTTTWLNWTPSEESQQLTNAISALLTLRKQHPVLTEVRLPDDTLYQHETSDLVEWFNERGQPMTDFDWHEQERDFLSVLMTRPSHSGSSLWIGFYREDSLARFELPEGTNKITTLFKTDGVNVEDDCIKCACRSVFVMAVDRH